mmetsp:Transcript_174647/g.554296  ORF Transcript_174647/g.554296 Transcript_174647/m.554296 type:complete len:224 (+) Transcript_174647:671-1342(+)
MLHLQGLTNVFSVNYLGSFWHTEAQGMGVPELAAAASERIRDLRLGEGPLVLVGHSLGGLVAAYIKEHALCPAARIGLVISVSGPLAGSALLGWVYHRLPPAVVRRLRKPSVAALDSWLLPESPQMGALRARMAGGLDSYRFITGQLDVMVRPDSALCSGEFSMPTEHRQLLPHLQHYNIAGSAWTWAQVACWIREAHGSAAAAGARHAPEGVANAHARSWAD